jgi:hypothetical protein
MSKKRTVLFLSLVTIITSALISCGKEKDIDKIGNAQLCLDGLAVSSTAADVNDCLSKIDGIESTAAYGIRCAGSFMKEGFLNPSKMISAMSQLNGTTGTTSFMKLITFTSAGVLAADTADSYTAFNDCLLGEGKGSTLFASFGFVAMSLYKYFNANDAADCPAAPGPSGYPFDTCTTGYLTYSTNVADPTFPANTASLQALSDPTTANAPAQTVQASIGAVLISTSNISCVGSATNAQLCKLITTAISDAGGTTNPRSVATHFFAAVLH